MATFSYQNTFSCLQHIYTFILQLFLFALLISVHLEGYSWEVCVGVLAFLFNPGYVEITSTAPPKWSNRFVLCMGAYVCRFLWLTRIRLGSHVSKDWPGKLSISLTTVSCLHHQSTCLLTWCILCILLYSLICMHDERGSQSCFNDMVISLTVFPLIRWAWRSPCHYRSDYRPSSDEFINSDGNWSWHKPWHILALFLVIFFNSKCFSRMGLTPEH